MSSPPGTPSAERRPPSAAERVERNREIAAARRSGVPRAALAERYGLSLRQVTRAEREAIRDEGVVARLDEVDGEAALRRIIDLHGAALDRLEVLLDGADNDNAQVGAARSITTVSAALIGLLRDAQLLPSPPVFGFDREFRRLTGAILDIAERRGLGSLAELWEDLDREADQTRLALEVPA